MRSITATPESFWVGFHKRGSGEPSITWPEAVDEALSFGWIDGVRRRIDSISYTIRFTPRKPKSIWSAVNIKRAKELIDVARMRPAGLKAFRELANERSAIYSYEQRKTAQLGDVYEKRFRANKVLGNSSRRNHPGIRGLPRSGLYAPRRLKPG